MSKTPRTLAERLDLWITPDTDADEITLPPINAALSG
jgi:hypothetical protein